MAPRRRPASTSGVQRVSYVSRPSFPDAADVSSVKAATGRRSFPLSVAASESVPWPRVGRAAFDGRTYFRDAGQP